MGVPVRLWDFLFYMSFGLVITHSVETAGVLLVFVFLVVPAVLAILLTDRLFYQLIIGWTLGTLVSFAGLTLSYLLDLPTGPAVVSLYGLVLLAASLVLYVCRNPSRFRALAQVTAGLVATGALVCLIAVSGKWIARRPDLAFPDWKKPAPVHRGGEVEENHSLAAKLKDMDLLTMKERLGQMSAETIERDILPWAGGDPDVTLAAGLRLLEVDPAKGRQALEDLLRSTDLAPFLREEARRALEGG